MNETRGYGPTDGAHLRRSGAVVPFASWALAAGWATAAVATVTGLLSLTLIDLLVLLGVTVVLPLALGGRWWWWALAAVAALVSLLLRSGTAAGLSAVPVISVAAVTAVTAARETVRRREWSLGGLALVLAPAYAVVAAIALAASRLGAGLFGIGEPIVELTAVHYTYAGSAALVLAAAALRPGAGEAPRRAALAVVLTACAPPLVAAGFVTGAALPQVGGAVLMALGVCLTAYGELHDAIDDGLRGAARLLLGVSGLAVWVPMALAVAWAAGQHWDVPVLSIPDMARTHGVTNALAFTLCGLLGRRLAAAVPAVHAAVAA